MQNVPKKKHAVRRHSRILLLIFAVVLVATAACLLIFARTPAPAPETSAHEDEEITLWAVESANITRIRIAVRNQDAWSAVQTESGALVLEGESAFTVDADIAETLLSGLKSVTAEVLSDDWNGTDEEWAAFGLDDPESVVTVDFADGSSHTLRIGSAPQYENSWQYAQLDGDTRLLSVSRGLAEECYVTRGSLHSVEQLTIHADRLDEITLLNAEGEITQQWRLNGAITNADAQDRWMLTTPVSYPADGTAMNPLRKSAANIRLGEYIADATAESIARYGLDTPRIVIRSRYDRLIRYDRLPGFHDHPRHRRAGKRFGGLCALQWRHLPLQHTAAARRHERRLAGDHYALPGADGAGKSCVPFA